MKHNNIKIEAYSYPSVYGDSCSLVDSLSFARNPISRRFSQFFWYPVAKNLKYLNYFSDLSSFHVNAASSARKENEDDPYSLQFHGWDSWFLLFLVYFIFFFPVDSL